MSEFIETVKLIFFASLLILAYTACFAFAALALLTPIYVYRMKKQMNKLEELIDDIRNNQELLLTIATHISKEITDKKEK